MYRLTLILVALIGLIACAPRGEIGYAQPDAQSTVHDIWVAKFRATQPPSDGQRLPPRPDKMTFERYDVAVPPTHQTGQIEWPDGAPVARTDFVTVGSDTFGSPQQFARQVARADTARTGTTMLFVHGYNYTHGEAVYQMAQIAHDFDVPSPTVLFSWPSASTPQGYLYDRDSVLISRDQLEQVIISLTREPGRKIEILAHSMGSFLVMETLRQIEISGSVDIGQKIAGLFMVSPDIDGELFYTQASRIKTLPTNTAILAAEQDRALRLAALLTGRTNRLGSETDRKAVKDLPVIVIDTSDLSTGGSSHNVPFTSPDAIAILKRLGQGQGPPPGVRRFDGVVNLAGFR